MWFGLAALGCESTPPPVAPVVGAPTSRRLGPDELVPRDLDLVVRMDVTALRRALGAEAEEQLTKRVSIDPMLGRALVSARTLTLALRSTELEAGDHVTVVEGAEVLVLVEEAVRAGFVEQPSTNDKVRILVAESPLVRSATGAVVVLDDRAIAFVSPLEVDAVLRVLREGADEDRGQPTAEGLVSADLRPRPLPPGLGRRYPSIARLIASTRRIKARLEVSDAGLDLDADLFATSEASAADLARFFEALREGATAEGSSALLGALRCEALGKLVHLDATLEPSLVLRLLASEQAPPEEPTDRRLPSEERPDAQHDPRR